MTVMGAVRRLVRLRLCLALDTSLPTFASLLRKETGVQRVSNEHSAITQDGLLDPVPR